MVSNRAPPVNGLLHVTDVLMPAWDVVCVVLVRVSDGGFGALKRSGRRFEVIFWGKFRPVRHMRAGA